MWWERKAGGWIAKRLRTGSATITNIATPAFTTATAAAAIAAVAAAVAAVAALAALSASPSTLHERRRKGLPGVRLQ